ncbi:MAG: phosphoribosyl-AMP cyclohydrolase [Casimicrobiaceae bacterium]|nr:phosphoribosyl-AMP cyclohydrolase [Casimicrobiaceae bacterium]MCX8099165.1 phosphoribosyl-AMP cyclohydrolase [Casimicrobiaceae bacterium]MDW8312604.1 phosphoribosyl-AMP cyclohydrolase [Burkholderiales bacterium]
MKATPEETTLKLLAAIRFDDRGLVPAIVQDAGSGEVLMLAWMDRAAIERTLITGKACYFSRSRGAAWMKGERSGHLQLVRSIHLDCDGDTLLLKVDQLGGIACHTGRRHCFFRRAAEGDWVVELEPIKSEAEIYGRGS